MMTRTFKKVSREEYLRFIDSWPNKLVFDCTGICEPPLGSYNDFSDGKIWPESMVAKESRESEGPDGESDESMPEKFWRYYVLESAPEPELQAESQDNHLSLNQTILNMMAFHEGQVDKTGVSYFNHPLRVMLRLGDSATDTERHAALLHDVIEDTTVTLEVLRELDYSEDVLEIVDLVSKREGETHRSFIYRIIGSRNIGAMRVKLADMIDNSCESRLVSVEEGLANDIRKMIETRYKPAIAMLRQILVGMNVTDDIRTEEIQVTTEALEMYGNN